MSCLICAAAAAYVHGIANPLFFFSTKTLKKSACATDVIYWSCGGQTAQRKRLVCCISGFFDAKLHLFFLLGPGGTASAILGTTRLYGLGFLSNFFTLFVTGTRGNTLSIVYFSVFCLWSCEGINRLATGDISHKEWVIKNKGWRIRRLEGNVVLAWIFYSSEA